MDSKVDSNSVSVAMCTYNGERYLPEQLDSIARQTFLPRELIICDDGSVDATAEIVEEFARSVSFPVTFIRNPENLGATKNFEKAISLCTSDFIALCDQDDIWLPEKLVRQSDLLKRDSELGGVFSDARIIDDRSQQTGQQLWGEYFFTARKQGMFRAGKGVTVMLQGNVVTGATLMMRANLQSFFLPIPPYCVHDNWIAWMTVLHSKLVFVEEPLIHYRVHRHQQIGLGNLKPSKDLSLRQRLEKGKREDSAQHLATARQLEALEERLLQSGDLRAQAVLPEIRKKIAFFHERGSPYRNSVKRMEFILRNAAKYHRYEPARGVQGFLRDLVLLCF